MPIDGSGLFTRVYDWVTDKANGVKIIAARMDGEFNNYSDALNTAVWRTGIVAMTGNFKMGGNSILGLADGSSAAPSISFASSANTGIYSSTVGAISLTTNGVPVLNGSSTETYVYANNAALLRGNATDSYLYVGAVTVLHATAAVTAVAGGTSSFSLDNAGMHLTLPVIFGNPAWDIAALAQATLSGSQTLDFKTFVNIKITMSGALTLANPASVTIGQSGTVCLKQDATGSRTVSWGTMFKWAGATAPVLSTAANSEDEIAYYIESASVIKCVLVGKAFS